MCTAFVQWKGPNWVVGVCASGGHGYTTYNTSVVLWLRLKKETIKLLSFPIDMNEGVAPYISVYGHQNGCIQCPAVRSSHGTYECGPPKLSNEKLRSSQFVNKNKETPNKTPSDGFMSSQLLLMDSHVNANTWNHFTRVSSLIWAGWLFRIIDHQFVGESTHTLWWPYVITSYKKLRSCDDWLINRLINLQNSLE